MLSNILLSGLIPHADKLLGITNLDFDLIGQRLVRVSTFVKYRKEWVCNGTVRQIFIDFKKAYDSVRREVL
jgi:hypothetical protein